MKQIHKLKNHKARDYGFAKFFNPNASPHTSFRIKDNKIIFDYIPKHFISIGRLVWNPMKQGTYVKQKHGKLK